MSTEIKTQENSSEASANSKKLENLKVQIIKAVDFKTWKSQLSAIDQEWCEQNAFKAKNAQILNFYNSDLKLQFVAVGVEEQKSEIRNFIRAGAKLYSSVNAKSISLDFSLSQQEAEHFILGWHLGSYEFKKYKKSKTQEDICQLLLSPQQKQLIQYERIEQMASAMMLARDLVNTPNCDLHPEDFQHIIQNQLADFDADIRCLTGQELLEQNFPTVYAVGKGSDYAPKYMDISWGNSNDPKVFIIGKGVCFDTGGYDIKPGSGMRNMKKDMGGAAVALGLAKLVMQQKLKIHLRLLIPLVENMVSGKAFVPGDIITSRKGITIEIDNTDAEGRLILCDALAHASEEKPDLILDFATLTGACRVALGQDLPGYFTDSDSIAKDLDASAQYMADPLWRLPLWQAYKKSLKSEVADLVNSASSGLGGAITAALFLQDFVSEPEKWVHFDVYCWRDDSVPGSPRGGEANALRAAFHFLEKRYSK